MTLIMAWWWVWLLLLVVGLVVTAGAAVWGISYMPYGSNRIGWAIVGGLALMVCGAVPLLLILCRSLILWVIG